MNSEQSELAVEAKGLWKRYQIWSTPAARLKAPALKLLSGPLIASKLPILSRAGSFLLRRSEGYNKSFDALREVSFSVRKGEALGIIGLNGSGKSTLLQILAGVLQASKGSYRTNGRVAALLELGAGFNGDFTGRENIYLYGAILGIGKEDMDKRFQQIADFAEIGDFMDQPVKTYSSGMVIRLAFSVITQIDPEVLIIDEALSVGDAYFRHKSSRTIRKFKKQGKTLLFVSHDPLAIKSLCDTALLLHKGEVLMSGEAEPVID